MTAYRDIVSASTDDDQFQILHHRKSLALIEDGEQVRAYLRAIERTFKTYAPEGAAKLKLLAQVRRDDREIIKGASVLFTPESAPGRLLALTVVLNGVSKHERTAFHGRTVGQDKARGVLGVRRPIADDVQNRVRMKRIKFVGGDLYLELLDATAGETPYLYTGDEWRDTTAGVIVPKPMAPRATATKAERASTTPTPANDSGLAATLSDRALRTASAALLSVLASTMSEAAEANAAPAEEPTTTDFVGGELAPVDPAKEITVLSPLDQSANLSQPREFSRHEVQLDVSAEVSKWLKPFLGSFDVSLKGSSARYREGLDPKEE
ncbi:hypothetical protein [Vitreimonas flagellata]|uniref:hypothetical protein n=1 Tax=Vitreimonas flagellata TaxID=2560861 RepID=UPI001074EF90|nr:hypothetical protein [Vitreimonas flagellata]